MAVLRERIQGLEEELQTAQERLDENENMRNALLQVQRPKRPNARPATLSRSSPHSQSLPTSSESMPTPDEGCVTISPYHVNDPNSWVDLVHNESIVRCPYCKINASIRQQDGRTWIAYYKGITAFVAHLSAHEEEFQKDQDNHPKYRGKSGKTERIKDATVPMTKEQKEAYHRNPKGEGYTVPPVLASNSRYKTWRSLKRDNASGEPSAPPQSPDNSSISDPISHKDKRPREEDQSVVVTVGGSSRVPSTFTALNEPLTRNRTKDMPVPTVSRPKVRQNNNGNQSEDHDEGQARKRVFTEKDRKPQDSTVSFDSMYRDSVVPPSPTENDFLWHE
jgi:uncharacterized Zn-finger protein